MVSPQLSDTLLPNTTLHLDSSSSRLAEGAGFHPLHKFAAHSAPLPPLAPLNRAPSYTLMQQQPSPQPHSAPHAASPLTNLQFLQSSPRTGSSGRRLELEASSPYLFDLYDLSRNGNHMSLHQPRHHNNTELMDFQNAFPAQQQDKQQQQRPQQPQHTGMDMDLPLADSLAMPLLERATTEQFQAVFSQSASHPHSHHMEDPDQPGLMVSEESCARCWSDLNKQQQFAHGWPVEAPASPYLASFMKQEYQQTEGVHSHIPAALLASYDPSVIPMPPVKTEQEPASMLMFSPPPPVQVAATGAVDEEEKSEAGMPSLTAPTTPSYDTRVPGKLARFLPDGVDPLMLEVLDLPPSSAAYAMAHDEPASSFPGGRALRVRKVRSRSPSADLSDRSDSPFGASDAGSDYDTDQYDHEGEPLDDRISPAPVHVLEGGGESSGQSSSEPPQPTDLLPVSASALLPSRPSHAAIPPAHIKDRLVKSAKKLLTAADGVNDAVQVQVIPIYYPHKGASPVHKIRLIRVFNTDTETVSMYAHAADVGGVVERKSNISRLFGKFESPSEKLLMNVVGAHNHTVGQESNILTSKGVRKFLATNKMKDESSYRAWISTVLLPKLLHDPLEIGEELLEIEASTDPNAPHTIKPKKMKRMEKKASEKKAAAKAAASSSAAAAASSSSNPASKRPKLNSPAIEPQSASLAPTFNASNFMTLGATPMSHAA